MGAIGRAIDGQSATEILEHYYPGTKSDPASLRSPTPQDAHKVLSSTAAAVLYPLLMTKPKPLVVGIAGGTGSGKSTVAANIAAGIPSSKIALSTTIATRTTAS